MIIEITFKKDLTIEQEERIKSYIFAEVYLNKKVSAISRFKDLIIDFKFIKL